jgi:hypothetical protein
MALGGGMAPTLAIASTSAMLASAIARPLCIVQLEKKPTGRVLGYSAESVLLLVVRAIPFAPSLFTTVVATVLERMQFTHSLLSFCTSFSQLSRYGLTNFLGMA